MLGSKRIGDVMRVGCDVVSENPDDEREGIINCIREYIEYAAEV